mmetsp:Transcript_33562/g.60181  ORF Transcript_33562/g.60181 Transcript_33562/m.60181 type:complete len:99 (-) Transcript_33562:13-309(-)
MTPACPARLTASVTCPTLPANPSKRPPLLPALAPVSTPCLALPPDCHVQQLIAQHQALHGSDLQGSNSLTHKGPLYFFFRAGKTHTPTGDGAVIHSQE